MAAGQFGAEGVRDLRLLVQMAVLATPTELERLATERDTLVAWLARQFPDALTVEDAEDLVADALPVLAADPRLPSGGRRRRNYLRRALHRDALDELRRRYGRDLRDGAREFVPIADAGELTDAGPAPDARLEAAQARAQRHAAVERTLTRLRPDDAEVLRLKYLEQRAPDEIAAELGLTRSQYQRRLTRASERGLDALTSAESGPACGPVRQLLRGATRHSRHDAARIDVHLLDCLHCRAYALRARGLLEVISVPVIGAWERFAARVGAVVGRGGGGSARDVGEAALASGTAVGAGTALTVGLGTKVAVGCAGVVLAAVCAGPLAHEFAPKATSSHTPRAAARTPTPRHASTPQATTTARPTTTPVAATPTPTATAAAKPKRHATRARLSESERRRRQRAAAAREFGPEAATPQVNASANASAASAATANGTSSVPPAAAASGISEALAESAKLVLQRGVSTVTPASRRMVSIAACIAAGLLPPPNALAGTATIYQCRGPAGQPAATDMLRLPDPARLSVDVVCDQPSWDWGIALHRGSSGNWDPTTTGELVIAGPAGTSISGGWLERQIFDYVYSTAVQPSTWGFGYRLTTADDTPIERCGTAWPYEWGPQPCVATAAGVWQFPNAIVNLPSTPTPLVRVGFGCYKAGDNCQVSPEREEIVPAADGSSGVEPAEEEPVGQPSDDRPWRPEQEAPV